MMEAPPSAALIVAEADFLFEFLIVALDAPAQLGEVDESAERHALVDGCEPEFRGRSFILRPFDQQRLFGQTRFAPASGRRARARGQSATAVSRCCLPAT